MTDIEFDVLDELYFVISFRQLQAEVDIEEEILKDTLISLLNKGWAKCFLSASEEALQDEININHQYKEYFYLASKAGLLAHNGNV